MSAKLDCIMAERRGSKIATQNGVVAFPVDPRKIAAEKKISVEGKPLTGCQGCLVYRDGAFGILYSTHAANDGMVNFTIAHELGHYFLDGHATSLFPSGSGVHQSQSGFTSRDPREREADHFAVGLLLPEDLFKRALRNVEGGLEAVETLAQTCGTSLTATAIRYAGLTDDPAALIVSEGQTIRYAFMSETLRTWRGIQWIGKGERLPTGTATAKLNLDAQRIERAERMERDGAFQDWFLGAPELDCVEQVVGLGRSGQTLTILWSQDALPDEDDAADDDW